MAIVLRTTNGKGNVSPFYYACFNYRGADGRLVRVKKSTGSKDKREAQKLANEMELRATELAEGRLTVERMREVLVDLTERITGECIDDYTAENWLKEWLTQKEATTKPRTLERYEFVIGRFLAFLGRKAKGGIQHVRPADARAFRQLQMDAGKSSGTCNMTMKILSMPFRKAQRLGIIRLNPCEGVDALESDKERRDPFTLDQVRLLLAHAGALGEETCEEWRGLILMGLYTGARLGDCVRMRWGSIDLAAATVAFAPAKTTKGKRGKKVFIPLHPSLHSYLMGLESPDDGEAFVFPKLAKMKLSGQKGISRQFLALMSAAGIVAPVARARGKAAEGVKNAGREVKALSFHSLRHTLTSLMHNAGVSAELRMQVTGHSTEEAHGTYTHTEIETLRNALANVPSL